MNTLNPMVDDPFRVLRASLFSAEIGPEMRAHQDPSFALDLFSGKSYTYIIIESLVFSYSERTFTVILLTEILLKFQFPIRLYA